MAPGTPSKKRSARSALSSPSASATAVISSPSAASAAGREKYNFSVPLATHVALLQILNGPDEYVANYQIYNQNPSLFGAPKSSLRTQVKNHRYYLETLRKKLKDQFARLCEASKVELRVEQQETGEPSAPLTSMSRNNYLTRRYLHH